MNYRVKIVLGLCVIGSIIASCSQDVVFDKHQRIAHGAWHEDSVFRFQVPITDTVPRYDIYIHVRNTTDYPNSNLYFFLNTHFPDGRVFRDTVECFLAKMSGEWNGKGIGKIRSNTFLFRTGVWFPQSGVYEFTFENAMRKEVLEGITDIGIKLKKI